VLSDEYTVGVLRTVNTYEGVDGTNETDICGTEIAVLLMENVACADVAPNSTNVSLNGTLTM